MATASWIESLLDDVELLENNLNLWHGSGQDDICCQQGEEHLHEIKILKLDLRFMRTFLRCARKWSQESGFKKNEHRDAFLSSPEHSYHSSPESREDFTTESRENFCGSMLRDYLFFSDMDFCTSTKLDCTVSESRSKIESFPRKINRLYIPSWYSGSSLKKCRGDFSMESRGNFFGSFLLGDYLFSSGMDFCTSTKLDCTVSEFRSEIESFRRRMSRLYIPSWYSVSSLSSSPVREEIDENMDIFAQNLADLLRWGKAYSQDLKDQIESLGENLKFLNNLISFATLCGVELSQLVDLLTHAEIIAVNATSLCYVFWFNRDDEIVCNGMQYKISALLHKIKPIDDPHVHETYIRVLTASKLSGSPPNLSLDSNKHVVRNFIDSLLGSLWELLNSSAIFMKSVKVQMQMLYTGLRFLRTILKEEEWEKLHKLHEKMKDPIEAVVSEAGIIVCSLFVIQIKELVNEKDLVLPNLLEKIKLINAEVSRNYQVRSPFHFPRADGLCCIDLLIENLKELECYEADLIGFTKDQIQRLGEDLVFLRTCLEKIVEQHKQHENPQVLWDRIIEVACKVELAVSSLMVEDIPDCFMSFDAIAEEIMLIKMEILEIYDSQENDMKVQKVQKVTWTSTQLQSQSSSLSTNEVVIGIDDEAQTIIDELTKESKKVEIVSIVGMPGIGKTTLAKRVYGDKLIKCHFHRRAWCYVSQVYCKQTLFLDILDGIVSKLPDHYFKMSDDDLAKELYRCLKGNRYLIFLDDVWDIKAWNDLRISFPDDENGSRILLTSRTQNVASQVKSDIRSHFLRRLRDDESWELLKQKLFGQQPCPQTVSVIGMKIARNCQGLPLTVVIIAGILATMEQDNWAAVAENLSLDIVCGTKQCMNSLELSYKHLPYYLKPCFIYFGAFPQGREISVWKLISLWIAEGFVQKKELKGLELEQVAEDYMMNLVGRSLVMVSKRRSTGSVKTCRVHDLLHEFCVAKAKEENFQQFLRGYDELSHFDEPCNLRRLCIHSEPEHLVKSRLYCPHVRCLLCFTDHHGLPQDWYNISFIFRFFKLLTVLDISEINLGDSFPSEIELLVWLRYLAVRGKMKSIPSSITKLSKLETFIVVGLYDNILLPRTIWNMEKLRHLRMAGCSFAFILPNDNLEDSSRLCDLNTLSTAFLSFGQSMSMEKLMKRFPRVQKLKCILRCRIRELVEDSNNFLAMDFLSRLESFNVSLIGASQYAFEIGFPLNLKKLTLSNYYQPWCKISTIGKLPNLEVLKLLNKAFEGEMWNMKEGDFLKLRILKLESLALVRWRGTSDDHLRCLEKLVLQNCVLLQEVPSCLKWISTLEMIEVRSCHSSLASLVREIEEEQADMGNEVLKVLVDQQ